MVNNAQTWLKTLSQKIDSLSAEIKQQGLYNKIFHEQLFGKYPINLIEGCQQCRATLAQLESALLRHKNEAFVQYYCDQLNAQLAALYNAKRQASSSRTNAMGSQPLVVVKLKEKLDQHREYERKLTLRVRQCQQAVNSARSEQFRQQWMGWLQTEQGRLKKCQDALAQIEAELIEAQRHNEH